MNECYAHVFSHINFLYVYNKTYIKELSYGLDDRVQYPAGAIMGFFLFATATAKKKKKKKTPLGPGWSPNQWIPRALTARIK
jgi:hypothetical protein